MKKIDEKTRNLIALMYSRGIQTKEIAAALGVSECTVYHVRRDREIPHQFPDRAEAARLSRKPKIELLPCPFCGETPSSAFRVFSENTKQFSYGVTCENCGGAIVPVKESERLAIEAWNRRSEKR